MSPLLSVFIFALIVAACVWLYFLSRARARKKLLGELEQKLFLIKIPQGSQEGKDLKKEINISEQLFNALASFNEPFVFEVAVPHVGREISFYGAVPGKFAAALVRQIHSLWPEATVEPAEDFNVFNYTGTALGGFVTQKERFVLPIRTYGEIDADTFLPVVGGLSKIEEVGEGGAIQFVVKPARSRLKKETQSVLKVLKKGWKLEEVLRSRDSIALSEFGGTISGKKAKDENDDAPKRIDEDAIKTISAKLSKPFFEVNIRVVVSAPSDIQAQSIFQGIVAGFSQLDAPSRNELRVVQPRNQRNFFYKYSYREFDANETLVLNSEELASVFHLPTPFTVVPHIKYLKAREASPPVNLPKEGLKIGESVFRGETNEVRISDEDRRRHLYIVGQTGTGKSNLETNMVVDDIRNGKGVAVIDPHGDLVEDILGLIPKNRFSDVIVFEPGDLSRPLGLNMLEYDFSRPEEKTSIVNEMLSIFDKLYDLKNTGGPMFEQYMRNALLLLMDDAKHEPATLMQVPRLFSDLEFRQRKLARATNPIVVDFWTKEAAKTTGEASLANMTTYVGSKFNNFTTNDYMRPIIGQAKSAFHFRTIMDEGKILLINLAKGKLGDMNANLLGMIVVGRILMAALGRVDVPQEQRRDFYLYIDEFQNFTTDSIAIILSEARKYKLNLTIAHQFISQLTDTIRNAVFGNVGSMISFRIGADDAEYLVKHFAPVFTEQDLINIDNFNAYVKLLVHGETTRPFNVRIPRADVGNPETAEALKQYSRTAFGRDREEVEREIYSYLRN